jgi:microcystin-dependent protein
MTAPFLAEIRIFTGGFAPKGWATCDGQLMPISQNTALFSLLGTTYGGDGKSTFALPNLRGSAPMQQGQGPGLSLRDLGEIGGEQTVTLLQTEMPAHSHGTQADSSGLSTNASASPTSTVWGKTTAPRRGVALSLYAASGAQTNVQMNPSALGSTGGNQPHNNMPPFLTLTFIIALQGVFPARP